MALKILIAAGGTGGHLLPAQQLGEQLAGEEILFAGYKLKESPFFDRRRFSFEEIAAAPLPRIVPFFKACWRGFFQSLRLLRRYRPDVIVGFGSYHTFPLLLAAVLLRKKIVLFEPNCIMGKVNRFFHPFSQFTAVQFPLKSYPLVPLLPWKEHPTPLSPQEARRRYRLDPDVFTILVFGGSQGASFFNSEFGRAVSLLQQKVQVIHLTGKSGEAVYGEGAVHIKSFESDMSQAYAAADLVVCRAGAGTVAELIRYQKPALLIPYPFAADDHQKKNGEFLSNTVGGARLLLQSEATPERIAQEIERLIAERAERIEALKRAGGEKRVDFASLIRAAVRRKT